MKRLERIAIKAIKEKAARMLDYKPHQIIKVEETADGAIVYLKNGNRLIIPLDHWA